MRARKVKHFIRSLEKEDKSDAIDAVDLAKYVYRKQFVASRGKILANIGGPIYIYLVVYGKVCPTLLAHS